jgi:preprotein translocase subunit SecF
MVKNSKIDLTKFSKYFLGTLGMILVAGIILISVIGMRLGFDYVGGTMVEVVYGVESNGTTYTEAQAKDIIGNAVYDYNLGSSTYQTEESSFGDRIVYKFTSNEKLTNQQITDLKKDLYTMFGSYDEENIIHAEYIKVYNVEGTAGSIAMYSSIALAVLIVLLAIGVFIRYGLSHALSILIVSIINILMVFAFVVICRISVDVSFIGAVFATFVLTTIMSLILLDKIRENLKNPNNKGLTRSQHANLAIKECFTILIIVGGISLICMILISGLGVVPIRNFGIPALFGSVLATLSTFFAIPYFCALIKFKKIK